MATSAVAGSSAKVKVGSDFIGELKNFEIQPSQNLIDTTNNLIKMRNAANSAWVTLGVVDQTGLWVLTRAGIPQGNLAGIFVGQLALDTTNNKMYACTTTGNAASAVWDPAPFLGGLKDAVSGLKPSPNAATPASKVDIATGVCQDANNTALITAASVLTADLTASGANGLDTGSRAATTWYYLWIIGKTDGTVASLFSTSASSPTMPSGYTLKRRLAAYRTDGSSNLLKQYIIGGWPYNPCVLYDVSFTFYTGSYTAGTTNVLSNGTATSFTSVSCAGFIPPISTQGYISWYQTVGSVFSLGSAGTNANRMIVGGDTGGSETGRDYVFTNSSQAIEYKRLNGSAGLYLDVAGYTY